MIYIIAILLLILVLANETARSLLFLLLIGAVLLAVAAAVLFGVFTLGVWVFTSNKSSSIPETATLPQSAPVLSDSFTVGLLTALLVVGVSAAIYYDQRKMNASPAPALNTESTNENIEERSFSAKLLLCPNCQQYFQPDECPGLICPVCKKSMELTV